MSPLIMHFLSKELLPALTEKKKDVTEALSA